MPWSTDYAQMGERILIASMMSYRAPSLCPPSRWRLPCRSRARRRVPSADGPRCSDGLHAGLHDPSCSSVVSGSDAVSGQEGSVFRAAGDCRTWLRANTSSPTRFITLSRIRHPHGSAVGGGCAGARGLLETQRIHDSAGGPRLSTRISPMRRGPLFCFSTASKISACVTPALLHQNVANRRRQLGRFGGELRHGSNSALRRASGGLLQAGQRGNQLRIVSLSFAALTSDTAEHLADRITMPSSGRGSARG